MPRLSPLTFGTVALASILSLAPAAAADSALAPQAVDEPGAEGPLAAGGPAAQGDLDKKGIGQYLDVGAIALGVSLAGILLLDDHPTSSTTTTSTTSTASTN